MTKELINIIDIHSHILPGIDDGPKEKEESNKIIDKASNDLINHIVFTPHFYPKNESPDEFIKRREEAFLKIEKKDNIKYYLGSEIYFYYGIGHSKEINKLTIGESKYILLELPFEHWNKEIIDEIEKLMRNTGLKPIIAHFNRYLDYSNKRYLKDLKRLGCLMQANTEFLLTNKNKREFYSYLKNGFIDLIASDTHNTINRSLNLKECIEEIEKSKYNKYISNIYNNYNNIINELN